MIEALEWSLLAMIAATVYPIVGYPLLMSAIALLRPRPVRRGEWLPSVTILVPAYNEAACIAATIENKLAQDYPAERLEIIVDSVIGVNGGVDAMRRHLYVDVPADQITDLVLPLRVIAAGFRVVFDERVRSSERANEELGSEFRMRVRVALRALRGLVYMRDALNVLHAPLSAFCIYSHKILRYLNFLFLTGALVINGVLAVGN